ncbi:MAG: histidine kinase [Tannerellaceae bacterium]|jgi:sensor histidine kinase YesM|nr:histidine kinase [Tannerellaceae bacterium]
MKNSILKYYSWFIAIIWVALTLTIYSQFVNICPLYESTSFAALILLVTYPITTLLSGYLLPKALRNKKMSRFIFYFFLFTFLLAFLYACINNLFVWFERKEIFPASVIFSGLARPLYVEFFGNILSGFNVNLIFCAIRFFEEHYKKSQEHAKLKRAYLEDELHLLRAQINPHLMFNVLNHIHILMKKNVDMADGLLMRYSDVLRYQLYECNRETVSLEKEIDYLKDVVDVEKMRWGNELKVNCSWNIENGKTEISPLLLIPFVENAFKHVSRLPSEIGYVNITLNQAGNTLRLIVENSRTNQALQKKNASGLGLENVKKRLEILYPGKHELVVQKTDTVYKATLVITL